MPSVVVKVGRDQKQIPTMADIAISGRKVHVDFDYDKGFTITGPRALLPGFADVMRLLWPADVLETAASRVEPVLEVGSATTAAAYAAVASFTVPKGKRFELNKIVCSTEKAAYIKFVWDSQDISCERLLDSRCIILEHFPANYKEMIGDGAKKFEVQAKYEIVAGTINAEIVGEEL